VTEESLPVALADRLAASLEELSPAALALRGEPDRVTMSAQWCASKVAQQGKAADTGERAGFSGRLAACLPFESRSPCPAGRLTTPRRGPAVCPIRSDLIKSSSASARAAWGRF